MSFLENLAPVVRAACDRCGTSRNLWVTELGGPVRCDHRSDGCNGTMLIVYRGLRKNVPVHLLNVQCASSKRGTSKVRIKLVNAGGDRDSVGKVLNDLGFPDMAIERAVQHSCNIDAALEWLMSPEGKACINTAFSSEAVSSDSSHSAASDFLDRNISSEYVPEALDIAECSVCLDHMRTSCVVMRCSGVGGKRHYYHAECLATWIRQCEKTRDRQSTCPECRGPLQLQPRRF